MCNPVYLVYIINSVRNVTRPFTLDPKINLSPIFTVWELNLPKVTLVVWWQNYSDYETDAINYYVLLPLSVQSLWAPAA